MSTTQNLPQWAGSGQLEAIQQLIDTAADAGDIRSEALISCVKAIAKGDEKYAKLSLTVAVLQWPDYGRVAHQLWVSAGNKDLAQWRAEDEAAEAARLAAAGGGAA